MERLGHYDSVWVVDFEYTSDPGQVPEPVCMVAIDIKGNQEIRLWRGEMDKPCPFDTSDRSLFVVYSGAGDMGCFLQLGWPLPERVVDLYPEVKQVFYDRPEAMSASLLNACAFHGIQTIESADKDYFRDLIIYRRYTDNDREAMIDYCRSDVVATGELFKRMLTQLTRDASTWNGVLLRGRYTNALAKMERQGIPIDTKSLDLAMAHWDDIKLGLVEEVGHQYGVYDGTSFKTALFEDYLKRNGIPWPRLDSGGLALDDDTFRMQARSYPQIAGLRELRHLLSGMRLSDYTVGPDGRNRVFLNPYGSVSGRNQPSNSRFIFGSARWARSFIKPPEGFGLAYVDWSSQEFMIGAALSSDPNMLADYQGGDVYLAFAIRAGLAPAGATKHSHKAARQRAKAIVLGTSYGMGAESIARDAGLLVDEARELLLRHRTTYSRYWRFVEDTQTTGALGFPLRTTFGWTRQIKPGKVGINLRSLGNWPMQANGAEMMRLACSKVTEAEIGLCCPVHDALLIEAPLETLDETCDIVQTIMQETSEVVLGAGNVVRTGADVVRFPDVYVDENAGNVYNRVMRLASTAQGRGPSDL